MNSNKTIKAQILDELLITGKKTFTFTEIKDTIRLVRVRNGRQPAIEYVDGLGFYALALYGKSAYLTKGTRKDPRHLQKISRGLYEIVLAQFSEETIDPLERAHNTAKELAKRYANLPNFTYGEQHPDLVTAEYVPNDVYGSGSYYAFKMTASFSNLQCKCPWDIEITDYVYVSKKTGRLRHCDNHIFYMRVLNS